MTTKATKKRGEVITPNFIRVETALKQFPFHLLDDRDQRDELAVTVGDQILWRVMFRAKEGSPRDLAYRIERLVIDAAIDDALRNGTPPKLIRLGTLCDVCLRLGINHDSGKNLKAVRTALLQLHGTVIDVSSTVHARWSKYQSIYFTGDKRDDGTRSDAVYVRLSDEYQKILADSQRRPLDYDYINELPGAAARLYEIIAPRVYAALKSGEAAPVARMLYSEICNSVGIVRYPDRARMAKQVHKLHQPHLKSGYFAKVSYNKRSDDWMMDYIPGARARREFDAVMRREDVLPHSSIIEIQAPLPLPPIAPPTEAQALAQRLATAGVSITRAQWLVETKPETVRLWLDVLTRDCLPKRIRDVGAYLTTAIATDQPPPAAYRKATTPRVPPAPRRPKAPPSSPESEPLPSMTPLERMALEVEVIESAGSMGSVVKTWDRNGAPFLSLLRAHLAAKRRDG